MDDRPQEKADDKAAEQAPEAQLPPFVIEGARSGRSKCKTCRRAISKGALRLGILIEGPYGVGYLWNHLNCAARRQFDRVEEAYADEAWRHAKEPPEKVPTLDSLRNLVEEAEKKKKERKEIPHVELDPSGRAKCKHCGKPMEKGSLRVVLGRLIEFGNQVRTGPVAVHTACVALELDSEECGTEVEGFAAALRENSRGMTNDQIDQALSEIGDVGDVSGVDQP